MGGPPAAIHKQSARELPNDDQYLDWRFGANRPKITPHPNKDTEKKDGYQSSKHQHDSQRKLESTALLESGGPRICTAGGTRMKTKKVGRKRLREVQGYSPFTRKHGSMYCGASDAWVLFCASEVGPAGSAEADGASGAVSEAAHKWSTLPTWLGVTHASVEEIPVQLDLGEPHVGQI